MRWKSVKIDRPLVIYHNRQCVDYFSTNNSNSSLMNPSTQQPDNPKPPALLQITFESIKDGPDPWNGHEQHGTLNLTFKAIEA